MGVVCVGVHLCMCAPRSTFMYVYKCEFVCICMCVCMCVYFMCICVCVCINVLTMCYSVFTVGTKAVKQLLLLVLLS